MRSSSFGIHLPISCLILLTFAGIARGGVLFSTLPRTMNIEARIESQGTTSGVAKAGEDTLLVSWGLNTELSPSVDDDYVDVQLRLCFAPVSQKDRSWRKTDDDLHRDKTCTIDICSHPWYSAASDGSVWKLAKDIPGATYFVRVYATDRDGTELAYGQTTDANKTTNLITVDPYTGRHASIDLASLVLSAISLGVLFVFLFVEALDHRNVKKKGGK
ncbi:hypothetical protein MPTK1_4g22870 [Marchantia polymorpha subsp. ruderalis]|nr:hypothetical protein MARPO_0020s0049 [Marchantia polymorpha]BBN09806.1 hypothetical protein Mp_4g22870 [Marchantia polymorpha subsp. ruderalis]|eukprot:PTQ44381.1 hypothetical protein MARPO_0020s0049 [Marchantia polymorpha]